MCLRLLLSAALVMLSAVASGQEFRMDTEVFVGDEKTPAVETLTIFVDGRVYDFLLSQQEITIFDPSRAQFVLLDEARRVKATVFTQDLMAFALELESHAVKEKHALLAFAAADGAWVVGSAVVLLLFWAQLTPIGRVLVVGVAFVVDAFAMLQYHAATRASASLSPTPLPDGRGV